MRHRLLIALALLVLLPLGLMVWAGTKLARAEAGQLEQEKRSLADAELAEIEATLTQRLEEMAAKLRPQIEQQTGQAEELRTLVRKLPPVTAAFAIGEDGSLRFPIASSSTAEERAFMQRSANIWESGGLATYEPEMPKISSVNRKLPAAQKNWGWHTWFWDRGAHFILWQRSAEGGLVGVEIARTALIADLIGVLPDASTARGQRLISLHDASGNTLYQWGDTTAVSPVASRELPPPLGMWKLRLSTPASSMPPIRAATWNVLAATLATGITLLGIATYLYRSHTREIREASQRVNFVNQVSHELKTPLTNIRLYAELLERKLPEANPAHPDDDEPRKFLDVIVCESQRLSRLINNVLTFAREQRGQLEIYPRSVIPDEVIAETVEHFRPSLEQKGVTIDFQSGAKNTLQIDPDLLGQILANLIGNVEKYAAEGGRLNLTSAVDEDTLRITVADLGPGIPNRERERIFRPFTRLSTRTDEGTAGTGIGLSISRELAELHGGALSLLPSERGARFELSLRENTTDIESK